MGFWDHKLAFLGFLARLRLLLSSRRFGLPGESHTAGAINQFGPYVALRERADCLRCEERLKSGSRRVFEPGQKLKTSAGEEAK